MSWLSHKAKNNPEVAKAIVAFLWDRLMEFVTGLEKEDRQEMRQIRAERRRARRERRRNKGND